MTKAIVKVGFALVLAAAVACIATIFASRQGALKPTPSSASNTVTGSSAISQTTHVATRPLFEAATGMPTAATQHGGGDIGPTEPFIDTFDFGKRSAWRLLSGDTVVKDGQLHSVEQAILQIGASDLRNYTVEFDTGAFTNFSWGKVLRASAYELGHCRMEVLKNGTWNDLVEIPCWTRTGRLRIIVTSAQTTTIAFYSDGQKQTTISYDATDSPGPFTLGFQGWIDNFRLTVP